MPIFACVIAAAVLHIQLLVLVHSPVVSQKVLQCLAAGDTGGDTGRIMCQSMCQVTPSTYGRNHSAKKDKLLVAINGTEHTQLAATHRMHTHDAIVVLQYHTSALGVHTPVALRPLVVHPPAAACAVPHTAWATAQTAAHMAAPDEPADADSLQ